MAKWKQILDSPYVLALLAGMYPALFYTSINWFMFSPGRKFQIVAVIALSTFLVLGMAYKLLVAILRKPADTAGTQLEMRCFSFLCVLIIAYLLRATFSSLSPDYFPFIAPLVAALVAAFITRIRYFRLSALLALLCVVSVAEGVYSWAGSKTDPFPGSYDSNPLRQVFEKVKFVRKPNVYLIVPDGYPNQAALKSVFGIDNSAFYNRLESQGFKINHSAYSNYMYTLASMGATFGMTHHYYRGKLGNLELAKAREFITSGANPVVRIFQNNGYRIHYVHSNDYMFRRGCQIDLCAPDDSWLFSANIIFPESVIDYLNTKFTQLSLGNWVDYSTAVAAQSGQPHFLYISMWLPGHSPSRQQSSQLLANFRRTVFPREKMNADNLVSKIILRILALDPAALIIVNADHGAWGLGSLAWAEPSVFEGKTDEEIAVDHLGTLMALKWPDPDEEFGDLPKSNINLFPHIFAYLAQDKSLLGLKQADDGFVQMTKHEGAVFQVIRDGIPLKKMITIE